MVTRNKKRAAGLQALERTENLRMAFGRRKRPHINVGRFIVSGFGVGHTVQFLLQRLNDADGTSAAPSSTTQN
jgi:hypothetical protein